MAVREAMDRSAHKMVAIESMSASALIENAYAYILANAVPANQIPSSFSPLILNVKLMRKFEPARPRGNKFCHWNKS